MKACIIANLYPPHDIGGAEVYLERISEELSRECKVILITSSPYHGLRSLLPRESARGNIKIYRFSPLNIYHNPEAKARPAVQRFLWHIIDIWNLHSYLVIRLILRKEEPDIVHTHNLSGFSLSAIAAAKGLRLPLIHSCHDFSLLCPFATLKCRRQRYGTCVSASFCCLVYRAIKRFIVNRHKPDLAIMPSRHTETVFLQKRFFTGIKREVIPYCIDTQTHPLPIAKQDGNFNVLYVGQLVEHKGVHLLIKAFSGLPYQRMRLHIVGDGDYAAVLKRLSRGDERIKFYGRVANSEVSGFYRLADVTVVPSLWPEFLGIVILESFSMSTPVIASAIGGITEIVRQGYNGFLFKAGDETQLKGLIEKVFLERPILDHLRDNAWRSSLDFGCPSHAGRLRWIYRQVAGLKNSGSKDGLDARRPD
ncbi:MAG: glycosyltransferase family 4 protein [Candidatus Omnitrophota bacterium]